MLHLRGSVYRPVTVMRKSNGRIPSNHRRSVILSHDFVTTVINRTAMPESPTVKHAAPVLNLRFESLYRIMLHYTNWTMDDTKLIAEKVKYGVPILTTLECEKIVKNAFAYGVSMICTIHQDKAVLYCEALLRVGLKATVEEA